MKIKKTVLCVLCALCAVLCLVSCGKETAKTIDLAALREQMKTQAGIADATDLAADRLESLYGIAPEDVKEAACFLSMGAAFPDEVLMIEATDAAAAARIAEKLNVHMEELRVQAQNYDAQSYALFEKCKVGTAGTHVTLFCSPKAEQLQSIFDAAAK